MKIKLTHPHNVILLALKRLKIREQFLKSRISDLVTPRNADTYGNSINIRIPGIIII